MYSLTYAVPVSSHRRRSGRILHMARKPWSYALLFAIVVVGCNKTPAPSATSTSGTATPAANTTATTATTGASAQPVGEFKELKIEDQVVGKGQAAAEGDTIWVLYTGKFTNGKVFDSTSNRGDEPFAVPIGAGQVIKGWDQGLVGMKVGGKRRLYIPWSLAYGERGRDGIPPKSDLIFDVEALALVKQGEEGVVDVTELKKGTGPVVKEGSKLTVKYVGKLPNGKQFDSTEEQGKPVTFTVGKGEVVDGLDAGVVGMREGGKRKIVIPPKLGFPFGQGSVPANSVVIFEVEAVNVE